MKRIFSAVFLIAAVYSCLAFAPKKCCAYCASVFSNFGCSIIIGKTELPNGNPGTFFYKYNDCNGTFADCNSSRCQTPTFLYNEY